MAQSSIVPNSFYDSGLDSAHANLPQVVQLATTTPKEYLTYIDSEDYNNTKCKFDNSTSVVLSGPSGAGKTWCANQVIAKYVSELPRTSQPADILFIQLDCHSLGALNDDLAAFSRQKKLDQPTFYEASGWDSLFGLFDELNKLASNGAPKFLILDDAECLEKILTIVNEICKLLKEERDNYWKIIVTSQKREFEGPKKYKAIGDNFVEMKGFTSAETLQLFQRHPDVDKRHITDLLEQIGRFPLALSIAEKHLEQSEFGENTSEFFENYLDRIKTEASELAAQPYHRGGENSNSALIAIKISIERVLKDDDVKYRRLIQVLACLNQKYISKELLISCAETVFETSTPSERKPKVAKQYAEELICNLRKRSLCTKEDNPDIMFSLHALVKESFELFLMQDAEKVQAIQTALESLNRLMPKDGRAHQTQYVSYYREHGEKLCEMIQQSTSLIKHDKMILLLQSDLQIGIGYCLLAQRKDYKGGYKKLKEALDTYSTLVSGSKIDKHPRHPEAEWIRKVAEKLYREGQQKLGDMIHNDRFKSFIKRMPLYHRLTKKDVVHMRESETDAPVVMLINDHLTTTMLDELSSVKKVITDDTKLGKVYIGEVLARIYHVMCRHYWGEGDDRDQCMRHGEAGIWVYKKIFDDHRVYLLSSLMTERDIISLRLSMPELGLGETFTDEQKIEELNELQNKLQNLIDIGKQDEKIGKQDEKKYAFEAGVMRSDLSEDLYNKMLCTEEVIRCQGRLYALTKRDEYKTEGQKLFDSVRELAEKQLKPHSALSSTYRKYAMFLRECEMYSEAVTTILCAMMELRDYRKSESKDKTIKHPELKHGRYKQLYRDLQEYYETYKQKRLSNADSALKPDMAQSKYLVDVVKHLNENGSDGNSHQCSDTPGEFERLEIIAREQNLIIGEGSDSIQLGVAPTD